MHTLYEIDDKVWIAARRLWGDGDELAGDHGRIMAETLGPTLGIGVGVDILQSIHPR